MLLNNAIFQLEHSVILPYRGSIYNIGPTLTNKKIIIQQFFRNILTTEIARKTSHSEDACSRYINGYKKVLKLYGNGVPAENIASELEMSTSLVHENVEIIEDLAETRKGEKE